MSADVADFEKKKLSLGFDESSDSDFSYDSDVSDRTYVASDDDLFVTAKSHSSIVVPSPEAVLHVSVNEMTPEPNSSRSSRSSRFTTPLNQVPSPYNLRSRSGRLPITSSAARDESQEDVGRLVKQRERVTQRNAKQIIESVKKANTASYYSSDDE